MFYRVQNVAGWANLDFNYSLSFTLMWTIRLCAANPDGGADLAEPARFRRSMSMAEYGII